MLIIYEIGFQAEQQVDNKKIPHHHHHLYATPTAPSNVKHAASFSLS